MKAGLSSNSPNSPDFVDSRIAGFFVSRQDGNIRAILCQPDCSGLAYPRVAAGNNGGSANGALLFRRNFSV
jgi:hypothetical protein